MNFSIFLVTLNKIKDIFLINRNFYNNILFPSLASRRDLYIKDWILNLPSGSKLFDAGAGIQRYKKFATHLEYTSQDFGEYKGGESFGNSVVKNWESKNCDIICDITNIPCDDQSFDFVLCSEVIEHLENPYKAIKELKRIVKSGGTLLITAPFRSLYHQSPYFYYSGFSKFWFLKKSHKLNLEILNIIPNGNYIEDLATEIIRTNYFGPFLLRIIIRLLTFPYLLVLFIINKYMIIKTPESCTGYFVLLKKKNKK